jgi:hypothetical protein
VVRVLYNFHSVTGLSCANICYIEAATLRRRLDTDTVGYVFVQIDQ